MKRNLWVLSYVPPNSVGFHIMKNPQARTSRRVNKSMHTDTRTHTVPQIVWNGVSKVLLTSLCPSTDIEKNHASTCLSETHMRSCHTGLQSTEMPRLTMLQLITAALNPRDNGNLWDK